MPRTSLPQWAQSLRKLSVLFGLLLGVFLTVGCEPPPISTLTPEDGIARLRQTHSEGKYEKVISDVNEYRSRYPYSQFAQEAELLQADSYFQGSRFPEAVVAYEEFLRKNPKHEKSVFASFRIPQSWEKQSTTDIDREQITAQRALKEYDAFLNKYPKSPYDAEAKAQVKILRRRLAEHNVLVGNFYLRRETWSGALARFLSVVREYPEFEDLKQESAQKASECYLKLAELLEKDPKSDAVIYFRDYKVADLKKMAADILQGSLPAPTR